MADVVLAVVSDTHCNSTVGLCPEPGVALDDGGGYQPTKAQVWLWRCWSDYWSRVSKIVTESEARLWVLFNGDLVDGDHHGTNQIISRNLKTQHTIAMQCLELPMALEPEHVFVVRGTEVHVGQSAQHEEWIADELNAEPDIDTGAKSWWHLRFEANGTRIEAKHHGRRGLRPWTTGSAIELLAAQIAYEYIGVAADEMPHLAIRSHVHLCRESVNAPVRTITTPAWQLGTGYTNRFESLADVGGLIVTCRDGGDYELHKQIYEPRRPSVWTSRNPS